MAIYGMVEDGRYGLSFLLLSKSRGRTLLWSITQRQGGASIEIPPYLPSCLFRKPTVPRLSLLRGRLSPITHKWPSGTTNGPKLGYVAAETYGSSKAVPFT